METEQPTRRMFNTCAAAGAAGWILTACGPKRLYDVPKERLRASIAELERKAREKTGVDVTISDAQAIPGVEFAYALDISRCIGCRRCVYACVAENNQSRDPELQWIRVLSMEKEKGVDLAHADPYYDPEQVPEEGHFYMPVQCQQCHEFALHQGLPDRRDVDREGRHRRHRLRLVHRLPLLHGRLPVWRAALQLDRAVRSHRSRSIPTCTTSATGRAPKAWSRSARSAFSGRAPGRYPACVEVCPVARASSATSSIRTARSGTSSRTSACWCLKAELNTSPRFFYFYAT